jgi:hypothetical protein
MRSAGSITWGGSAAHLPMPPRLRFPLCWFDGSGVGGEGAPHMLPHTLWRTQELQESIRMVGDGMLSTEAPPNSAGGIAATRFPTIHLESVSDRSLGQVHSHAPGIQEEAQTCVRRVQARRAHSSTSGVIRYRACENLNSWNWSACDAPIRAWRFASEPVHGARSNLALFELDILDWFSVRTSPSGCSQDPKGAVNATWIRSLASEPDASGQN